MEFSASPLRKSDWFPVTWWNPLRVPACCSSHNNPERQDKSVYEGRWAAAKGVKLFKVKTIKGTVKNSNLSFRIGMRGPEFGSTMDRDQLRPLYYSKIKSKTREHTLNWLQVRALRQHCTDWWWLLTVTGLVSTSLMYSATVTGPVDFILEVRCLSMEGWGFSSVDGLQKSLLWAPRHRTAKHKR